MRLFSIPAYDRLADEIRAAGNFERGEIERSDFPDGERYRRIVSPIEGEDVAILAGTISDSATLEAYDLACAAAKYGARRLTIAIPYFGYSTMERATKSGEVVTAKTRARLFSAIPRTRDGNRVILLDVHSEGIPYYFEGDVTPVHVYAKPLVAEIFRSVGGADFVLGSTDAGRAKWVESLANDLGVEAALILKRRHGPKKTEVVALSARVEGRRVVLYDDMVRTGSSLVASAQAYKKAGAASVAAVATHGVLPADSLDRIRAAGAIDSLTVTDSHPRARELEGPYLRIVTVAPLLAGALAGG